MSGRPPGPRERASPGTRFRGTGSRKTRSRATAAALHASRFIAMLTLDGSMGEGGGQILRTALSLSAVSGAPFRMEKIRARRPNPGLARQHRTAVRAVAEVSGAEVEGAEPGSTGIVFRPGVVRPGEYRFSTGGAGSAMLVLQTVLPPLMTAPGSSRVVLEGGTHNPFAPPYEFVERTYAPLLRRMDAGLELRLRRPGFHPAGGGRLRARIDPVPELRPLVLDDPGEVRGRRVRAYLSDLPSHIAERELRTVGEVLGVPDSRREVVEVDDPAGPGNALVVEVERQRVTGVFTGFGRKGVPAEEVARKAAEEARRWEMADVTADPRLADQLLVPLAMAGGGAFTTLRPTSHARTNAEVVGRFLDVDVAFEEIGDRRWRVEMSRLSDSAAP